jgi:DNA-binding FrmR family transcriptional regulator
VAELGFEEGAVRDVLARLRRIEGQIRGVIGMIEQGRDCAEVIQQMAAAKRALDRTGVRLLASQLRRCLADEEAGEKSGHSPADLERLFLTLT